MDVSVMMQMAASLAVLALLAECHGVVRRRIAGAFWAPVVMGIMFGLVAVAQMQMSLEVADGLLIDLRNIPIALAGAYLGWRGLLPCLLIAVAARLDIGGIGTSAGIWSMVIAGLAGMIWARKRPPSDSQTPGMLMLLALAMSAHLLGALALPRDLALWFFTSAAGPLLLVNLVAMPLIGALLEREVQRSASADPGSTAHMRDPETGLLMPSAFVHETTDALAVSVFGMFSGFVRITPIPAPRPGGFFGFHHHTGPIVNRHVLLRHLDHGGLGGKTVDGSILVPLNDAEVLNATRVLHDLRHAIRTCGARSASTVLFKLSIIATPDPESFLHVAQSAVMPEATARTDGFGGCGMSPLHPGERSRVRRGRIFDREQHEGLFAKAEFLMDRTQN